MPNDLLKKLEWGFKQNSPLSPCEVVHWDKIPCKNNYLLILTNHWEKGNQTYIVRIFGKRG